MKNYTRIFMFLLFSFSITAFADAIKIGNGTVADTNSIAIGEDAWAIKTAGYDNIYATGQVAIGYHAKARGLAATAFGAYSQANGLKSTAYGDYSIANGYKSVAFGPDSLANGDYSSAFGSAAQATGLNSFALGANAIASKNGSVAIGYGSIADLGTQTYTAYMLSTMENSQGDVSFGNSTTKRKLTNVAAGENDTDAANIRQLKALDNSLTSSIDYNASRAVNYGLNQDGSINYFQLNLNQGYGNVLLTGLSKGTISSTSSDAVTGAQLYETNSRIIALESTTATNTNRIETLENAPTPTPTPNDQDVKDLNNRVDNADKNIADNTNVINENKVITEKNTQDIQDNSQKIIKNTNAIEKNTDDIKSVNEKVSKIPIKSNNSSNKTAPIATGKNSLSIGDGSKTSGDNSVAIGADSSDEGRTNTVSVGSSSNQRTISNVAKGVKGNDAVNVDQLNNELSDTLYNANNYSDKLFHGLDRKIDRLDRENKAGIAAAMSMAGMPQAYSPGKSMVSVGIGNFRSENAISVGASVVSDEGHWVYKINGAFDSTNRSSTSAGVGYQW